MDVKKIESLARLMQETGLTGLELVEGDMELRLERQQEVVAVAPAAPVMPTKQPSGMASVMSRTTGSTPSRYRKLNSLNSIMMTFLARAEPAV